MKQKPMRIAAVIAVGIVLVGTFTFGTSSAAFSQVGDAVSSTLARLKNLVTGIRARERAEEMPAPSLPPATGANEQMPVDEEEPAVARRVISAQMQLWVSMSETDVARLLKEQQIDLVQAGTDPNVCFAVLGPDAAENLSVLLQSADGVGLVSSPRLVVGDGGQGMLGTQALGVAWQPTIMSDGELLEVNLAVHNGESGFELPALCIQIGEALLIRTTGIMLPPERSTEESAENVESTLLILVRMDIQEPTEGPAAEPDEEPAHQPQ